MRLWLAAIVYMLLPATNALFVTTIFFFRSCIWAFFASCFSFAFFLVTFFALSTRRTVGAHRSTWRQNEQNVPTWRQIRGQGPYCSWPPPDVRPVWRSIPFFSRRRSAGRHGPPRPLPSLLAVLFQTFFICKKKRTDETFFPISSVCILRDVRRGRARRRRRSVLVRGKEKEEPTAPKTLRPASRCDFTRARTLSVAAARATATITKTTMTHDQKCQGEHIGAKEGCSKKIKI